MASEILKEQGGRLTAATAPEGGACFTIWLPQADRRTATLGARPDQAPVTPRPMTVGRDHVDGLRADPTGRRLGRIAIGPAPSRSWAADRRWPITGGLAAWPSAAGRRRLAVGCWRDRPRWSSRGGRSRTAVTVVLARLAERRRWSGAAPTARRAGRRPGARTRPAALDFEDVPAAEPLVRALNAPGRRPAR